MNYYKLFNTYHPQRKCGAGTLLMAGLGVLGSAYGYYNSQQTNYRNLSEAKKENERNRQYQSNEAEIARQWAASQWKSQYEQQRSDWYKQEDYLANLNRDQFLYEANYNSPQNQVQRLQAAGINAGAMFGSGGSGLVSAASGNMQNVGSVSVPSGGTVTPAQASSSAASIPQLQNPMSGASMFGNMINDLASAYQKSETTRPMVEDILAGVQLKVKQAAGVELANTYQEFENYVMSKTKDTKVQQALQDLSNTAADTFLKLAQGSEVNSQTLLNKADLAIKSIEKELKGMDLVEAKFRVSNLETLFNAQISMYKAQTASANASAALSNAQTETENESRDFKVNIQQINRDIARLDWRKKFNETFISNSTTQAEVKRITAQCEQAGIITKQLKTQLDQAIFNKDWQLVDKIFGMVIETANTASNFIP